MTGSEVQLRAPRWIDISFIRWLWSDPETMAPVGGPVDLSDDRAERWFAGMVDPGSPTDCYRLVFDADNRPVGEVSFHRLRPETMTAELNIKIASAHRRKGYARRALLLFLDHFFNQLEGKVLIDDLGIDNTTGQKALVSFGFEVETTGPTVVRLRMTRETYNRLYAREQ